MFQLANILLKERGKNVVKEQNVRSFSQKIRCKESSSIYRYRKTRDKIYWVCRKHDKNAQDCEGQRILESEIEQAFVNLYNKLRKHYTEILVPLYDNLEKLQQINHQESAQLQDLNQRITKIAEQNQTISALIASDVLDATLFVNQLDTLKAEMEQLKAKKKRYLQKSTTNNPVESTEMLIYFLESAPVSIDQFQAGIFEEMVKKVIAHSKNSIEFQLINGLILKERLG